MNVEKGLVKEVKNSKDFKDIINSNTKIVIINIQKFTNIKKLFNQDEIIRLQNRRSIFIIDEIHRSNAGSQHDDMMSLLSSMFREGNHKIANNNIIKKNLLIGLTATPSEETLLRFGEYSGCDGQGNIIYKPHDSFSMIESINEGFTLPFHTSMTPIAISMEAVAKSKQVNNSSEDKKVVNHKSDIYENEDRIEFISEKIVKQLFNNVYRKIYVGKGGKFEGKAMLACYSIEAAIKHHKYIKSYIDKICDEKINNIEVKEQEKELYRYYKETGVYIVYSNSENKALPKASKLNDNKNERTILNDFKNKRNGIIIVVDKLQTGFDEKKLHTLFLNTEKTGISLIQLLSRVNRTYKGKNECHIIDFSHDNVNTIKNLPEAWKIYGGEIFSNVDLKTPIEQIEIDYNTLIRDKSFYPFKKDFINYLNNPETEGYSQKIIEIEYKICEIINTESLKENNQKIKKSIFSFFHNLQLLDNIIEIDNKYKDYDFKIFFRKILNLFNECKSDFTGSIVNIDYIFQDGGDIINEIQEEVTSIPAEGNGEFGNGNGAISIENIIRIFNEKEALKEEKIENFDKWINLILDFIDNFCDGNQSKNNIIARIEDNADNSELIGILEVLVKKSKRTPILKNENIPEDFFNILVEFKSQELLEFLKLKYQ